MITRGEIINELKKHKNKSKEFKKEQIKTFLKNRNVDKKRVWKGGYYEEVDEIEMILDDLNSYVEY